MATATPQAAGVIAYLLSLEEYSTSLRSLGRVARNVRDFIVWPAWKRMETGPLVVWNGYIDPDIGL
jgi:hypothetical protein